MALFNSNCQSQTTATSFVIKSSKALKSLFETQSSVSKIQLVWDSNSNLAIQKVCTLQRAGGTSKKRRSKACLPSANSSTKTASLKIHWIRKSESDRTHESFLKAQKINNSADLFFRNSFGEARLMADACKLGKSSVFCAAAFFFGLPVALIYIMEYEASWILK